MNTHSAKRFSRFLNPVRIKACHKKHSRHSNQVKKKKNMKSSFIQWSIRNEGESINLILWIPSRRQRKGFDNLLKGLKAVDKLIRIRLHKFDSFSCCHFALSDKTWTFFFLCKLTSSRVAFLSTFTAYQFEFVIRVESSWFNRKNIELEHREPKGKPQ